MKQLVGITGFGAVSAAGIGSHELWEAARNGVSQVGNIELPRGENLRVKLAALLKDFDPNDYLSREYVNQTDRFTQIAHVAAIEAIKQSGLSEDQIAGARTAVIIGSGVGGANTIEENCFAFYSGERRYSPMIIPKLMPSAAASHISIVHQINGPCFAVTSACSSASQSIGLGMQMIRSGVVDRAIVGGSEASITAAGMKAWEVMRVLSPDRCRPFSRDRNGLILGEGAGVLILESEPAILSRGGEPLAWLTGYGTTSDAKSIIQPDVDGAANAMAAALSDANLEPEEISYINAHGTGTVLNDVNEAAAINTIFGEKSGGIPVSSTKPIIGHTLGASGALEFIVTVKAMIECQIPPNINTGQQDEKCNITLPEVATSLPFTGPMICNTFAFGGVNATLVVEPVN